MGLQIRVINAEHQPRDRCSLRRFCARAARRSFCRKRPLILEPARAIGPFGRTVRRSRDICQPTNCRSWRADELWASQTDAVRQVGVYAGRVLKGAKPAENAGRTVDEVRTRNQRADRSGARPRGAVVAARARRRGHRVKRRHFIAGLAGAAAWPFVAQAQQPATAGGRNASEFARGRRSPI